MTHILSLVLGAVASYIVWWWLNRIWVPILNFSSEISRYVVEGDQKLYVCAFKNAGKRDIVDVQVITRIGVKNFNNSDGWLYFSLKTNSSQLPIIEPKRRALVRIFDQREELSFVDAPPPSLKKRLDACRSLEDVFDISTDVVVQLHVFGYDSFSGARSLFSSPAYSKADIRSGRFEDLVVTQGK